MFSKIKEKSVKTENKEHIKVHLFTVRKALYSKIITIIDNFVGHKNWTDTCDVRIQLYWVCKNTILESIWVFLISCSSDNITY